MCLRHDTAGLCNLCWLSAAECRALLARVLLVGCTRQPCRLALQQPHSAPVISSAAPRAQQAQPTRRPQPVAPYAAPVFRWLD
jgi:hypothetical protein